MQTLGPSLLNSHLYSNWSQNEADIVMDNLSQVLYNHEDEHTMILCSPQIVLIVAIVGQSFAEVR